MEKGNVFGGKKSPADSSFWGVSRKGLSWIAELERYSQVYTIGRYDSKYSAAVAYDMEALRAYGCECSKLNFSYEVIERLENGMIVRDSGGRDIFVDTVGSPDETYAPVKVDKLPFHSSIGSYGNYMSTLPSDGAPPCAALNRPWHKRIISSYTPSASFSFEITFPHDKSLGLNLRPRCIRYPSGDGMRFMGALVVVEITSLLSSIVYPGDILLRINDQNLVEFGDSYEFDKCTSAITTSPAPRVVTFLRPLGPTHTLCPAELCAFLGVPVEKALRSKSTSPAQGVDGTQPKLYDLHPVIAKYSVVVNQSSQSLQLTYLAPDAPVAIKNLMQGTAVHWEGSTSSSQQAGKQTDKTGIAGAVATISPPNEVFRECAGPAAVSVMASSGSYSMGGKWVAQLVITEEDELKRKRNTLDQESTDSETATVGQKRSLETAGLSSVDEKEVAVKKRVFIGRYDTEADARAVVRLAREEWNHTGNFTPRRLNPPPKSAAVTLPSSTATTAPTQTTSTQNSGKVSSSSSTSSSSAQQKQAIPSSTSTTTPRQPVMMQHFTQPKPSAAVPQPLKTQLPPKQQQQPLPHSQHRPQPVSQVPIPAQYHAGGTPSAMPLKSLPPGQVPASVIEYMGASSAHAQQRGLPGARYVSIPSNPSEMKQQQQQPGSYIQGLLNRVNPAPMTSPSAPLPRPPLNRFPSSQATPSVTSHTIMNVQKFLGNSHPSTAGASSTSSSAPSSSSGPPPKTGPAAGTQN